MPQNIERVDFDAVLKKPSSNKLQENRFLANYSKPYFIDGIILPSNFELNNRYFGILQSRFTLYEGKALTMIV